MMRVELPAGLAVVFPLAMNSKVFIIFKVEINELLFEMAN